MKALAIAIVALVLSLVAIAHPALAQEGEQAQPQITLHDTQIQLGSDGSADVLEKYYLKFSAKEDLQQFIADAERNGPSLQAWTIYDNRFFPHFGDQEGIGNARISFDNRENALRLEYHLERGIVEKSEETSRQAKWSLSRSAFNTYVKSGIVILPANTQITIALPQGAVPEGSVVPEARVSEGRVSWKGYLTTNLMSLSYATGKPIAQPLDAGSIVQAFFNSRQNLLIIIIAALLVLLVYWKRNGIERRIEDYIVEHSSFEHKEQPEEEVEIESEK